jgi:hypothetical protein
MAFKLPPIQTGTKLAGASLIRKIRIPGRPLIMLTHRRRFVGDPAYRLV